MCDFQKMYTILFNAVTDALREIAEDRAETAVNLLVSAQQKTEELFISGGED